MGNSRSKSANWRSSSSRKKSTPTPPMTTKLVAEDDSAEAPQLPGLVMEKGGYEDVIKKMETGRKEELAAVKKKEQDLIKQRLEEEQKRKELEEADRELKEKNQLTQLLVTRFESDKTSDVKKEVVVEIDNREKMDRLILALEAAAFEKNPDRDESRKSGKAKGPFQREQGDFVSKRMRSYKKLEKAARADPTKTVDESDERWERESSLQKNAKVRKTVEDIYTREQRRHEFNRMADELKNHFDLDAVLAAAGMNLETLIDEQPEDFLKLYYRSRHAFGKEEIKKTHTTHAQLQDAIRTSMAHMNQQPVQPV